MIKKTDAVVLRTVNYGDQSKIVTVFTREFGKLSCIAKGCRNPKSKYASLFEVGNHLDLVLYKKSTREVQLISEAQLKNAVPGATDSLEKLSAMHQVIELLRLATEDDDKHLHLYQLLLDVLGHIAAAHSNFINFFFYFEVRLISLLGFRPNFGECVVSGAPIWPELESGRESHLLLVPDYGGIALERAAREKGVSGKPVSTQVYRMIQYLSETNLESIENLFLEQIVISDVSEILDRYFRFHIEDLPPLRSRAVFNQLV